MTVSSRVHLLSLTAVAAVFAVLPSCSKATKAEPRVTSIPNQTATGGDVFSLDLSPYATPPAGQTLTFSVLSGGGVITGSTYTNTFPRVGTFVVALRAHALEHATDFGFTVTVLTADEAVVQAGTGLVLLDRGTVRNVAGDLAAGSLYSAEFITVSNSQGNTDTFKAALTRGHVVYERAFGSPSTPTDLFVFNPNSPQTTKLGPEDPTNAKFERFEAVTADNRVVFTSGTAADPNLYIFSVGDGLTREISAQAASLERNAWVDSGDLVYFEKGPAAQRDIYVYDPATDVLSVLSADAANEVIAGVVQGGGVVFTRDNGAGDIDLWFYKTGIGLTQVAADVGTAGFQDGTLAFKGSTPNGMVVFEHTISATDVDLYYWNPNTQTTTVVAANAGVRDDFHGVTSNDKIVYTHKVSPTDWDVRARQVGGADVDCSQSADLDVFQAITSLDDVVIVRGGTAIGVWDDSAAAQVLFDSGAAITFDAALAGGNVVYTKTGTGLRRWLSTNAVATVSATGAFAGALSDGNFVVKLTVSLQDDLSFWNEASDTLSVATADAADERFVVATTSADAFVFSRLSPAASYELFVWDAIDGVTSISNAGLTHTHVHSYALDNR